MPPSPRVRSIHLGSGKRRRHRRVGVLVLAWGWLLFAALSLAFGRAFFEFYTKEQ